MDSSYMSPSIGTPAAECAIDITLVPDYLRSSTLIWRIYICERCMLAGTMRSFGQVIS